MSKTAKNSLLIITLVCVIALIVFSLQLILLNRNRDESDDEGASISSGDSFTSEDVPEQSSPPTDDNGSIADNGDNLPIEPPATTKGTQYNMQVADNMSLVWYIDDEMFESMETNSGVIFTYLDEGNASIEICLTYIPYGADASAETFLEGYLGDNESNIGGYGPIRQSPLSGVFVSGVNDGETFEAWIYTIEDDEGDMGIAFVIRYRNDEQKNALHDVLNTIDITEL